MAKKSQASGGKAWYALAGTRVLLSFIFLWAFFDKLLGLGFSTTTSKAWINGGSPTAGFLKGVDGPFVSLFHPLIGQAWVDWLFMLGLLGVGIGLLFGVAVRLSAAAGSLLLFMMWMASLPIAANPIIDEHIVYITALIAIGFGLPQQRWSVAGWWQRLSIVKSNPWLK